MAAPAACGGDSSDDGTHDAGADGSIFGPPPGPQITAIAVDGGNVRQGSGGAPTNAAAVVHVTGTKLGGATSVVVAGDIQGVIVTNTPTELAFTVNVPHGAPLGVQALAVTTAEGTQSVTNGVTIVPITAAPTGADSVGDTHTTTAATEGNPVRSLAKAISLAAAGDTILLKNGVYDRSGGDDFAKPDSGPNVPVGLTIRGESIGGVRLVGGKSQCGEAESRDGLVLAGATQLESLDISGFCVGIQAKVGAAHILDVAVHDNLTDGIQVAGTSEMTFENVDVSKNMSGVSIADTAKATITNGHVSGNANWGIISSSGNYNSLAVTGTEFSANGTLGGDNTFAAIKANTNKATTGIIAIVGANFHDNDVNAVVLQNVGVKATITSSTFKNNHYLALNVGGQGGPATVTVRGSTFVGSLNGIYLNGAPVDLGTVASPGGNTFETCSNSKDCAAVADDRDVSPAPVPVHGNTWTGIANQTPPTGCSAGDVPYPAATQRFWRIAHPGTCSSSTTGTGNVMLN